MKFQNDSRQSQVFTVLKDKKWHCRGHEYADIDTNQLAGGGGIQGLQRGTRSRDGLVIESKDENCPTCNKVTRWDRWTGETQSANAAANVPKKLVGRILQHYDHTDVIEQRKRPDHELVIDHRFPMERWGGAELKHASNMTQKQIESKFQLLKKDSSGNHNLLKSRACENCIKTRRRGMPFGINFFYEGTEVFRDDVPVKGKDAEQGCHGCGWYDFAKWRDALNRTLAEGRKKSK